MVKFNELRITEDASHMVIDAEIMDLPYYKNIAITEVVVQHYDQVKFVKGKPVTPKDDDEIGDFLGKHFKHFEWGNYSKDFSEYLEKEATPEIEEEYVPVILLQDELIGKSIHADLNNKGVKRVRLFINKESLNFPKDKDFSEGLFFVFVKTNIQDPDVALEIRKEFGDLPCERTREFSVGITMDISSVYRRAMCLIKDVIGECKIPKHLIDFILRWKAFKIAVENGDYETAIEFYEKFILDPEKKMIKPFKSCGCHG